MPKTTRRRAAPLPSVAAAPATCPASDTSTDEAHPQRHVTLYGTARDLRHDGFRTGTRSGRRCCASAAGGCSARGSTSVSASACGWMRGGW